jgi:hypothetical protein
MKRILSLIGVVLVVGCGGPEPRDVRTLQELDGVYMNPVDGQPYSGPWFLIEDGMRSTGSLKDGKLDGTVESYLDNGQLRLSSTYKDGELDGTSVEYSYYESGQLQRKTTFKDGVQDGPFEGYDENGQLMWKGTTKDRDQCGEWLEEGETVTYDPC